MQKIQDSMLVGLLGGFLGVISMDISGLLLWRAAKTEGLYAHLAGSMIMNPLKLKKRKNFLIGQIFHMSVGSGIGILMVEILKKYGKDHHNVKGGFLSVAAWSILYNFGQRMGFYRVNPRLIRSSYASIFHHLIYGLVASNTIIRLADPRIFTKESLGDSQLKITDNKTVQSSQPIYSNINYIEESSQL